MKSLETMCRLPANYLKKLEAEANCLTAEDIDHHAFMATQYEQYGGIDFKAYMREIIIENMDDDDIVSEYMDYLRDNRSEDEVFTYDDLMEQIQFMEPEEILRLGHFSRDIFTSNLLRYDGYGNLEGIDEYDLRKEALDDNDFLDWLINNCSCEFVEQINSDEEVITKGALKLVSMGY